MTDSTNTSNSVDTDSHDKTEALKDLATEVEQERTEGTSSVLPDDDTPEDDGDTRENHEKDKLIDNVVIPPAPPGIPR
ncbi:hypothetical protein [Demequina sediminicola]|uniref:hypothetical protein n=1 Tax=Demequina sediminicola TaxID=1095026 RepID=UPI00078543C9|nr:hypothetical protein [Demequina sediminicola]